MINIKGETTPKIANERTYRANLLKQAREAGCEKELLQVFDKYDKLLRNCTNIQEKEQIGMLGVLEVSKLLDNGNVGKGGCVIVNGQVVISDE